MRNEPIKELVMTECYCPDNNKHTGVFEGECLACELIKTEAERDRLAAEVEAQRDRIAALEEALGMARRALKGVKP